MIGGIKTAVDLIRDGWPGAVDIVPTHRSSRYPRRCLRTLIANGDLGPATLQKVTFEFIERGVRHPGARLQTAIGATPDGAFGPRTENAVEELTRAIYPFGGPVSGKCGPELWEYVLWTEGLVQRPILSSILT